MLVLATSWLCGLYAQTCVHPVAFMRGSFVFASLGPRVCAWWLLVTFCRLSFCKLRSDKNAHESYAGLPSRVRERCDSLIGPQPYQGQNNSTWAYTEQIRVNTTDMSSCGDCRPDSSHQSIQPNTHFHTQHKADVRYKQY